MTGNDSDPNVNISKVAVKPPPFWKADPTLWFAQLEAQFSISSITQDDTKFYCVISAIEPEILHAVRDLILTPPTTDKYTTLKNRLIEQHAESEESKIRRLLQGIEIGDQRPSQLLNRMRSLAGEAVGETLLKSLWLARLPTHMQGILAALNENLTQLASTADKINELPVCYSVNAASSQPPSTSQPSFLEQQISALTKQVQELSSIVHKQSHSRDRYQNSHNRNRSPSRNRHHSRNRQYKEPSNDMCFYHTNFGSKARKCSPGCKFSEN